MSADLERQIFEDSGKPGPEAVIPDAAVDEALSKTIRNLDRGVDRETEAPTPQRERQAPPDGLDGVDDRSTAGLLKALMDERDRRQEAVKRADRAEQFERDRAAKENRPPLNERLFTDPDGTLSDLKREWTQPLEQQIAQLRLDQAFTSAQARHGEERFTEAWNAWYSAVDGGKDATSYFAVMNAPNPGEAMVSWHKRRQRDEMVGDDIDAYRQRVIDEYTAAQRGESVEERPRSSNGQFTARPQAPQLPTSLSRMGSTGGKPGGDDVTMDGSDAAIFAAARPQRRK